jgi:hypothetical protein
MKKILAFVITLLVAGSLAASAFAASLSPGDGTFTGTGIITLRKGSLTLTCTLNLTGHITNGVGTIDTATFSGGTGGLCATISKVGTWIVTAISAGPGPGTATISGFSLNSPLFGTCGPSFVSTRISNSGLLTIASTILPPDCQIDVVVQTSPPVIVVP